MDSRILSKFGLSTEQANVYSFLLETGMCPAKTISAKIGTGRALTYKVLKQLISMGLAEKRDDIGKITLFFPSHPQKIKEIIRVKNDELQQSTQEFEGLYGKLASNFNMLLGKPNVQFYEGLLGLQRVYDDILDIGETIYIISSPIDKNNEDGVLPLIREQIKKQVSSKIWTKAITPIGPQEIATPIPDDKKHLIERKEVPAEKLNIPAQIIIYGDKVSITNFKENMITVVIESKYIKETFKKMFDYIWNSI